MCLADDNEFSLNESIDSRESVERASRTEGISLLSRRSQQLQQQNAATGLTETLKILSKVNKSKHEFIESTDGVKLAYRPYLSSLSAFATSTEAKTTPTLPEEGGSLSKSCAMVVLVAGNSHFHDIIASQLSKEHPIDCYILEMRGYGYSGGLRGFSPSKEQVWIDIRTFLRYLKMNHTQKPIFLGGHFHQGGLVLNYATWKDRQSVDGYLFISPNFDRSVMESGGGGAIGAAHSGAVAKSQSHKNGFATVNAASTATSSNFVETPLTLMTNKIFYSPKLPSSVVEQFFQDERDLNPMIVDLMTSNITRACFSPNPQKQFELVDRPFGFWMGGSEEVLVADRVVVYPRKAHVSSTISILPELTHFGVLNSVAHYIGKWILMMNAPRSKLLIEHTLGVGVSMNLISFRFKSSQGF